MTDDLNQVWLYAQDAKAVKKLYCKMNEQEYAAGDDVKSCC